jgi:hypothetical protein
MTMILGGYGTCSRVFALKVLVVRMDTEDADDVGKEGIPASPVVSQALGKMFR